MGFVVYSGSTLVGSLAGLATDRFLVLSHPSSAHSLALTEMGESGYSSSLTGFLTSDGRTVTGGTRVQGGGYQPKQQWSITECICNELQLRMFESLVALQTSTGVGLSLQDSFEKYQYQAGVTELPVWLAGSPTTNVIGLQEGYTIWQVFVDVDGNYKTFLGNGRYILQFTASAV